MYLCVSLLASYMFKKAANDGCFLKQLFFSFFLVLEIGCFSVSGAQSLFIQVGLQAPKILLPGSP